MSLISWRSETGKLKGYSASVKGNVSIIRIELEIRSHADASFVLADLEQIETTQKTEGRKGRKPIQKDA